MSTVIRTIQRRLPPVCPQGLTAAAKAELYQECQGVLQYSPMQEAGRDTFWDDPHYWANQTALFVYGNVHDDEDGEYPALDACWQQPECLDRTAMVNWEQTAAYQEAIRFITRALAQLILTAEAEEANA